MDVVTTATPLIDAVPVDAENMITALFTTGNIVVIEAKDLKNFAIKAGIVAAYAGIAYWSWSAQIKPAIDEHKQNKAREAAQKRAHARLEEEEARAKAKTEGFDLHKVLLKQKGSNKKTYVTVKVPLGTTYKDALVLAQQGKAEIVDEKIPEKVKASKVNGRVL